MLSSLKIFLCGKIIDFASKKTEKKAFLMKMCLVVSSVLLCLVLCMERVSVSISYGSLSPHYSWRPVEIQWVYRVGITCPICTIKCGTSSHPKLLFQVNSTPRGCCMTQDDYLR